MTYTNIYTHRKQHTKSNILILFAILFFATTIIMSGASTAHNHQKKPSTIPNIKNQNGELTDNPQTLNGELSALEIELTKFKASFHMGLDELPSVSKDNLEKLQFIRQAVQELGNQSAIDEGKKTDLMFNKYDINRRLFDLRTRMIYNNKSTKTQNTKLMGKIDSWKSENKSNADNPLLVLFKFIETMDVGITELEKNIGGHLSNGYLERKNEIKKNRNYVDRIRNKDTNSSTYFQIMYRWSYNFYYTNTFAGLDSLSEPNKLGQPTRSEIIQGLKEEETYLGKALIKTKNKIIDIDKKLRNIKYKYIVWINAFNKIYDIEEDVKNATTEIPRLKEIRMKISKWMDGIYSNTKQEMD